MSRRSIDIDPRSLALRNMWTLPTGELCVRPGLRRILTLASSRVFVDGFSVFNSHTGETIHYIFDVSSTGALDLTLRIYDEDFLSIQNLALHVDVIPRTITHAALLDVLVISSPDFPTLWGWIGSGVQVATPVTSVNPRTTSLPVPRGICTTWANRVVICDGSLVYVSDPVVAGSQESIRTFVPQNIISRGAAIFGAHETQEGMLVVVTAEAVWGLPSAAAASGIVGRSGGQWFHITDFHAQHYESSALVLGAVYALTERGVRRVDTRGSEDIVLNDPPGNPVDFPRVAEPDFRIGRITALDRGFVISMPESDSFLMADLPARVRSWWQPLTHSPDVRGVLRQTNAEELLVTPTGVLSMRGSVDGEEALPLSGGHVTGYVFGNIPFPPNTSPTLRSVHIATDSDGAVSAAARAEGPTGAIMPAQPGVTIIGGGDVWNGTGTYRDPTLQSERVDFAVRGDEIDLVVSVQHQLSRVGRLALDFEGVGETRPTD